MHTRPPSAEPSGMSDREGAYNVRSVPVRLYLPDGPVMQGLVPPMLEDGKRCIPCTLVESLNPFPCQVHRTLLIFIYRHISHCSFLLVLQHPLLPGQIHILSRRLPPNLRMLSSKVW